VSTEREKRDALRDEFLAEAQEIVESLSRDLLVLDQSQKERSVDPDLVNEVFRAVHTLKGVAGMFGYAELGRIAHQLEDLLDALRLGRVELSQEVLDVLFEGVDDFQRLLSEERTDGRSDERASARPARMSMAPGGSGVPSAPPPPAYAPSKPAAAKPAEVDPLQRLDLDPNVLAVLTEYEEHRLRTNVQNGVGLFRLRVRFSLASIDASLEELKARAKPVAEIITYLPSMEGGDGDHIDLDVLLASRASTTDLRDLLVAGGDAVLTEIAIRRDVKTPVPAPMAGIPEVSVPRMSGVPHDPEAASGRGGHEARDLSADQLSLRSVASTVRVDIRKLDHLMNIVGELAIVRSAVGRVTERIRGRPELRQLAIDLHRVNRGFERHLAELQDGILDVRMVPLGHVFDKLARVVRQVAREHGKEVRLSVTGAETEVDKLIVEELSDPLMHIIRNAIDHGIETPDIRGASGKRGAGTLALNAYQKGNHVVIEVEDDGRGMDEARLRETAVQRGIATPEAAREMSRDEAYNLIFLPGFSTSASVTDISGRGVGMDVVKTNIARLGGVIDVQTEIGVGTKFTITLPVTLAIINALLVRVRDRNFAIPIAAVQEAIVLDRRHLRTVEGREVLSLRGSTLPLCRLADLFQLERLASPDVRQFVVVSSLGSRRLGFVVDSLEGQQDIVIKSLGRSLSGVRGLSGATDLGDQRVCLVLDAPGLLEEVLSATTELGSGLLGGFA